MKNIKYHLYMLMHSTPFWPLLNKMPGRTRIGFLLTVWKYDLLNLVGRTWLDVPVLAIRRALLSKDDKERIKRNIEKFDKQYPHLKSKTA